MKEHPILFSGEMVRAILDGRKTQTRRVIKPQAETYCTKCKEDTFICMCEFGLEGVEIELDAERHTKTRKHIPENCPYGKVGDSLWVRETWVPDCATVAECRASFEDLMQGCAGPYYRATASNFDIETLRWKPSIHMPRWASRVNLEITDIRVERVQDISEEDAKAEGSDRQFRTVLMRPDGGPDYRMPLSYRAGFAILWNSINGKPRADGVDISWDANPFVWCLTFKIITKMD